MEVGGFGDGSFGMALLGWSWLPNPAGGAALDRLPLRVRTCSAHILAGIRFLGLFGKRSGPAFHYKGPARLVSPIAGKLPADARPGAPARGEQSRRVFRLQTRRRGPSRSSRPRTLGERLAGRRCIPAKICSLFEEFDRYSRSRLARPAGFLGSQWPGAASRVLSLEELILFSAKGYFVVRDVARIDRIA